MLIFNRDDDQPGIHFRNGGKEAEAKLVWKRIEHVERVTLWWLTDNHSWLNSWPWKRVNHGLLFDRQARPKPAFHAVSRILSGN